MSVGHLMVSAAVPAIGSTVEVNVGHSDLDSLSNAQLHMRTQYGGRDANGMQRGQSSKRWPRVCVDWKRPQLTCESKYLSAQAQAPRRLSRAAQLAHVSRRWVQVVARVTRCARESHRTAPESVVSNAATRVARCGQEARWLALTLVAKHAAATTSHHSLPCSQRHALAWKPTIVSLVTATRAPRLIAGCGVAAVCSVSQHPISRNSRLGRHTTCSKGVCMSRPILASSQSRVNTWSSRAR